MSKVIRIVHLEDVRSDAEIVRRELNKGGFEFDLKWVSTKDKYQQELRDFTPDVVISDHSMPGYTSVEAFRDLQKISSDVPFILVTATVSEEFAVSMMKEGIADYILKDRLQRLPSAITNVLEKQQAERDRNLSVEMLMQNEKRFRGLIENSHDMIGVADENFNPIFVSSSYTRITGRTLNELRAALAMDFVYPEDRSDYYATLEKAKKTPGAYLPMSYRLLHQNGTIISMEGTVISMLHDDAIQGIIYNLRDVTDRKRAEELLQKSRANLTAIIENSNASIYSLDRQFKYISFNSLLKKNLKQAYGLDIKAGDQVFEFLRKFDPSQVEEWERIYTEAFRGNSIEFEKEFKYADYHAFTSFSINPIIEGDYVTGLSCFAWDITPQKIAALKLSRSEARFRALIENNNEAIVLRDEQWRPLYASPSVARILGYSTDELIDGMPPVIVHPDDANWMRQVTENVKKNPGQPFAATMRLAHKDGHFIWLEGVITNMTHKEDVQGIISNFRDISERKESELQREKITLDLIERNKNLEQYAYIVSHNLRGPVANILGISNILELELSTEEDKKSALTHLFSSTRKLDEVIKDLNMILQLQQNISETKEQVDFQELVNDVLVGLGRTVTKSNVQVTTNFKVKSISTVKSYLYSIFYNLISNSIKYKQDGTNPTICISSNEAAGHIQLKFTDTGLGIDLQAHGANVFGLYKRFHLEHAEGKGIGLFMTKTQVEVLGGKITVTSQVNVGTEFVIEL